MKFARALLLITIFSIPFGTDLFLGDFSGRGDLPRFQEFSSLFVYGIEVLILAVCAVMVFGGRKNKSVLAEEKGITRDLIMPGLFLLFSLVAFKLSVSSAGFILLFRLMLAISFAGTVAVFLRSRVISFSDIAATLAASALFQSVVGILQFTRQRSIGLWFLGEPVVDFMTSGVGRVFVDGGRLLRSFGTLPHANIYAAFLVLGLAALFYFFLKEDERKFSVKRIALSFCILFLLCALLFSFSRSGWIGAGVLMISVLALSVASPSLRFRAWVLFLRLVAIGALLFFAFGHLAVPRAVIPLKTDPSFNYRLRYNEIGYETIHTNLLGVGLGNQVAYGVKAGLYTKQGIGDKESSNWQPIHNLYLLVASEAGIPALFVFIVFLFVLGIRVFKTFWKGRNSYSVALVCTLGIFGAFLVLGLSDHYFWDLVSGRLMFWLVLGLLIGVNKNEDWPKKTIV